MEGEQMMTELVFLGELIFGNLLCVNSDHLAE